MADRSGAVIATVFDAGRYREARRTTGAVLDVDGCCSMNGSLPGRRYQ